MIKCPDLSFRLLAPLLITSVLLAAMPNAQARMPLRFASRSSRHTESNRPKERIEVSPDLIKATKIAERNAKSRSIRRCWRYVKRALVAADAVNRYPNGVSAKYAGRELTRNFGFTKLDKINKPEDAPVGAVLVYGGRGHGHVEFRTKNGYVSDFKTSKHSTRPLIGVYVKPAPQ